jgi:hypothetical protein
MGIKDKEFFLTDGSHHSWAWVCPACDALHQCDSRWTFNGDLERPTFRASVLVDAAYGRPRCHSFVTAGRIAYCPDSTHAHAGKELEIPDWDFARGLGGAAIGSGIAGSPGSPGHINNDLF